MNARNHNRRTEFTPLKFSVLTSIKMLFVCSRQRKFRDRDVQNNENRLYFPINIRAGTTERKRMLNLCRVDIFFFYQTRSNPRLLSGRLSSNIRTCVHVRPTF